MLLVHLTIDNAFHLSVLYFRHLELDQRFLITPALRSRTPDFSIFSFLRHAVYFLRH